MVLGYVVVVGMKLRSFGIGDFNSDRRRTATHSTLKRIILTHLQTLALVFGLSVPWPELMLNAISIVTSVTTFSENAKGVECLIEGQKITLRCIMAFSWGWPFCRWRWQAF